MKSKKPQNILLSQQAYQEIKQRIIRLDLPPDSIIDESELQKELGLGRTPVREAIQRLALENLVTIIPRRGIFVTDIRVEDLGHIFEVRLSLESLAVRLATQRGNHSHWDRIEQQIRNLPDETDPDFAETLISVDERIHHILYTATGNDILCDTLDKLYALSIRLWFRTLAQIGDMKENIEEHLEILNALRAKDADLAEVLIRKHIRSFQHKVHAALFGQVEEDL